MKPWKIVPLGVFILGVNLMFAGVTTGFLGVGLDGMEDLFPLFMLNRGFGGQSNYINRPTNPVLPIQPELPIVKPPSITWRWVPNFRYMWPMHGNHVHWGHSYPQYYPMMNQGGAAAPAMKPNSIAPKAVPASNIGPAMNTPSAVMFPNIIL